MFEEMTANNIGKVDIQTVIKLLREGNTDIQDHIWDSIFHYFYKIPIKKGKLLLLEMLGHSDLAFRLFNIIKRDFDMIQKELREFVLLELSKRSKMVLNLNHFLRSHKNKIDSSILEKIVENIKQTPEFLKIPENIRITRFL